MAGGAKPPRNVAAIISENREIANKSTSTFYGGLSDGYFSVEQLKTRDIVMKIKDLTYQQVLNKSYHTTLHWAKEKHRHEH